jgi:hypothetical protein
VNVNGTEPVDDKGDVTRRRARWVSGLLAELSEDSEPILDTELFLAKIVDAFGGVDAFCKLLYEEYAAAKPGTVARARLISLVHAVIFRTAEAHAKSKLDFESMETKDLENLLTRFLSRRLPNLEIGSTADSEDQLAR